MKLKSWIVLDSKAGNLGNVFATNEQSAKEQALLRACADRFCCEGCRLEPDNCPHHGDITVELNPLSGVNVQ